AIVEALMMEIVFEGLREAGIRLPKAVGSAVSIVGALVIGQAAVQAGIVSAPMVIIVAMTGIASFAIPRYNLGTAVRMIRFGLLLLAGALGLYGIVFGFILLTIHLVNLRSFGVPYFSPVAPQIPESLKDVLVRVPRWALNQRPALFFGENKTRIPAGQKPNPERGKNKK
ncbi:MAG TPA: spore germination protein, partial [Chondromyces sp.]|nr:spore germination protein [Chondromyces sp.]